MFLLPRLSKQVMRRSSPERLGLDLRLVMALSYLGDHDETPQQELVDALCMDAKNVVLLLNELEERGYLIRRRDSEDRRRHRVHITPEGREALARAGRRWKRSRTRCSRPWMPKSAPRSGSCSPARCTRSRTPPLRWMFRRWRRPQR